MAILTLTVPATATNLVIFARLFFTVWKDHNQKNLIFLTML
jgi:hypothetical protein